MEKVRIKNGDLVNGVIYNRNFDFVRDSWKELVYKILSDKWNCDLKRKKHLSTIENILKDRIERGLVTQKQIDDYGMFLLKKKFHYKRLTRYEKAS